MTTIPDPSLWVKLSDVATQMGVSRRTLDRLIKVGRLRCGERIHLRTWHTIAGRVTTWEEVKRVNLLLNLFGKKTDGMSAD